MKKLFVAVLAIAALAACQKDEVRLIETNKKAISITIANAVDATRAVEAGEAFETAKGSEGQIQNKAPKAAAATTDQLYVLFANSGNSILEVHKFNEAVGEPVSDAAADVEGVYTYTFHNVSESVTQVAVVRPAVGVTPATGEKLDDYQEAARAVDAMEQIDLDKIALYGYAELNYVGECSVPSEKHDENYVYDLYAAKVRVAPTIARVEVFGFDCTDLGETTGAIAEGQNLTGGFDSLNLEKIEWGGVVEENPVYYYTFEAGQTLEGVYAGGGVDEAGKFLTQTPVAWTAGDGKAIAWNIDPKAAVPTKGGNMMVVTMHADRHDNPIPVTNNTETLSIGFTNVTAFEAGKIYTLDVEFLEENLDTSNESICVEVEVTIDNWEIEVVEYEFNN